ncbi:MAG TPA: hypothetical protein VG034_18450 [Acidimicrobiia bacterium]|nr:hypothetical protein [Acidimicrobiia bacterium]
MISVYDRGASTFGVGRTGPDSGMVAGVLGLVATLVVFTGVMVLAQPRPQKASAVLAPAAAVTPHRALAATLVPAPADPAIPPGAPAALPTGKGMWLQIPPIGNRTHGSASGICSMLFSPSKPSGLRRLSSVQMSA